MQDLINLDENLNLITKASLVQDFRNVYSSCEVVFSLPEDIVFQEGSGFYCWGTHWDAVSCKKLYLSGSSYTYSVFGYPSGVCTIVKSQYDSLSALARGLNIKFDSKYSDDLKFEFPLHGLSLGSMLFKYRYSSIEENVSDPSNAWFLYYDERGLVGQSYASLMGGDVLTYDMGLSRFTGGSMSFIDDFVGVNYCRDQPPSKHGYKKLISSFIGEKFDIRGRIPGLIGARYSLKGAEEDLFSKYGKLVLVRQKYDSGKLPLPWSLTFGQLLVG